MWLYTFKLPGFGKHALYEESAKMSAQSEVRVVFIYLLLFVVSILALIFIYSL